MTHQVTEDQVLLLLALKTKQFLEGKHIQYQLDQVEIRQVVVEQQVLEAFFQLVEIVLVEMPAI